MTADRLERLRQQVDAIIPTQPDAEQRRCGYVHLYGVSATCVLLAHKRGLNVEICAAMGMLHDIWSYGPNFSLEKGPNPAHGSLGIPEARRVLQACDFSPGEVETICTAIGRHSAKSEVHGPFDELLKDADVFQHYLYNPALNPCRQSDTRLSGILNEFGISP
ncbi:MAG: HD domain-containing protein [Chloroflexota bacterium]